MVGLGRIWHFQRQGINYGTPGRSEGVKPRQEPSLSALREKKTGVRLMNNPSERRQR